jgi:hypothetical protein
MVAAASKAYMIFLVFSAWTYALQDFCEIVSVFCLIK